MPFDPTPMLPGDAFEAALRFGQDVEQELARLTELAARAACLARHWNALLDLGWAGTLVPEEHGGAGGTLVDLAALAEGAGRSALPLPLAATCAVAPTLLAGQDGLLADLAAGRLRPCVALTGDIAAETGRLTGRALGLETPPVPTHALIAASDSLFLVPMDAPGIGLARHERIDGRLTHDLELRGAPATLLAEGADALAARARDLGALISCVEAVAAMAASSRSRRSRCMAAWE
jgi:alkylation response protein AidB-like acyl-CoA dehydrogenase